MEGQIARIEKELETLKRDYEGFKSSLQSSTTIPFNVDQAFRTRLSQILELPQGFEDAPLSAITAPTGGATVDTQARTAINTIITRLEDLGLVLPN